MFSPKSKGSGKRLALLGSLTALALGTIAPSAFATVEVSPEPAYPLNETTTVFVRGTAPSPMAAQVAIAVCNHTGNPGERCDLVSASGGGVELEPIANYESEEGIPITVRRSDIEGVEMETSPPTPWTDYSFLNGFPEEQMTATACTRVSGESPAEEAVTDPCVIEVSYYTAGFMHLPVGDEEPISFE